MGKPAPSVRPMGIVRAESAYQIGVRPRAVPGNDAVRVATLLRVEAHHTGAAAAGVDHVPARDDDLPVHGGDGRRSGEKQRAHSEQYA